MDAVFQQPGTLKKIMQEGMRGEAEKGQMTEQELETMLDMTDGPSKKKTGRGRNQPRKSKRLELKGEGGSGEKSKKPLDKGDSDVEMEDKDEAGGGQEEPDPSTSGEGQVLTDAEEERNGQSEEDLYQPEGMGGDMEAMEGDVGTSSELQSISVDANAGAIMAELKAYCEDQFSALNQIVQPLLARVEALERRTSVSIPVGRVMASPPHKKSRSQGGGSGFVDAPATSGSETSKEVVIDKAKIVGFLQANPGYPNITQVRRAKLKTLQQMMGLTPQLIDVKTSNWTLDGLYATILGAQD